MLAQCCVFAFYNYIIRKVSWVFFFPRRGGWADLAGPSPESPSVGKPEGRWGRGGGCLCNLRSADTDRHEELIGAESAFAPHGGADVVLGTSPLCRSVMTSHISKKKKKKKQFRDLLMQN